MTDETQPTSENPRFLARTGRHGTYKRLPPTSPTDLGRWQYTEAPDDTETDHGYTSSPARALPNEPECVGPAILDGYAELADFQHTLRHKAAVEAAQQLRPTLKAEDRLKDAQRRAKQAHRKDLSGEFLALKHMLAHDRKGGGNPSASTLVRLERIEARLDGLSEAA